MVDFTIEEFVRVGPPDVFAGPFAAILNSRQSKTPAGRDPWIRKTLEAVEWASRSSFGIVTSVGMITWELVLHAASQRKLPIVVVVPQAAESPDKDIARIECDFGLTPGRAGFVFPRLEANRSAKGLWPSRDGFVISFATILVPISIRPDGNLARLISTHGETGVRTEFEVPYTPTAHHSRPAPQLWTSSGQLTETDWPYLIHFTRTCHGPWPCEKPSSFYTELLKSADEYPRNAMATLRRILSMGQLIGSSSHLRGGIRAVAFTEVRPHDAQALMRWRKRFVRWSFEPYGIGIHKEWAKSHGFQPVRYGLPEDYDRLAHAQRPYFQNRGGRSDWRPEREWRLLGDLNLKDVPRDALCALARKEEEAAEIRALFDVRTYALCQ